VSHVWTVKQGDTELGTVEAVSRKGACHAAFEKFGIAQPKRSSVSVEILHRDMVRHRYIGIDPATPGGDKTVYTEVSRHTLGDVVCSFNPALAGPDSGKTLADCRLRFDMPPFTGFPNWKED
jgi:hypothetical protein